MENNIPEFSNYMYDNGKVFNIKSCKEVKPHSNGTTLKLKHDIKGWNNISLNRIKGLCGDKLILPEDAKVIPYTNGTYYIDENCNVYSFSIKFPAGKILTSSMGSKGYLIVSINFKGKKRHIEIHQLMARTFIQEDYVEQGLVCMHEDNVAMM